jgi:aspartate/methionine/tyrosine aminotransferase
MCRSMGCVVEFWRLTEGEGGAVSFDVDQLEALVQPGRTKLVVINFPHNPTGCLLTRESVPTATT